MITHALKKPWVVSIISSESASMLYHLESKDAWVVVVFQTEDVAAPGMAVMVCIAWVPEPISWSGFLVYPIAYNPEAVVEAGDCSVIAALLNLYC